MFINDLAPMPDATSRSGATAVAVGWLDLCQSFTKGPTPLDFRHKLGALCMNPVRRTRGFHICPFCKNDQVQGNGEIHVPASNGEVFVAPSLVWHYVVIHNYQPPNQFVNAVLGLVGDPIGIAELSQSVLRVADEPSSDNRNAFYQAFVKNRVGVRVPAALGSVVSGNYITTSENTVSVPIARLPDGKPMLLVLADVDKLAKLEAATTFVELDAKDVIKMAVDKNAGIIVQASLHGRQAWAGIPQQDVASLSSRL